MIPALSIRQPWAWLIVHGYKHVENRDWNTHFRGRVLVHAGQTLARRHYDELRDSFLEDGLCPADFPAYEQLQRGGFVGSVRITDCIAPERWATPPHINPWYEPGSFGFMLVEPRPLHFVPFPGKLGFFNVPVGTGGLRCA